MMSEQKSSWSLPFFVKVLAIVFIVSVALAGTISLLADRTSKSIAIDGVRLLAQNTTAMVAKKIPGAVKFRKVEDIDLALETLSNGSSDTLQATIVFDLEGTEVTALGNAPTFRSEMAALATQAMETGQAVMSDDALLVVQPIQFGKDSVTVGAIASQWTPEPILERIAVQTRQQYLLGAGILVALLTAMGVVMNAMFSRPLKRLVQRTLDLAEGDFQSEIGDDNRRDEIGDVARSLKILRTQLREAEKIRAVAAMKSAGYMASSAAMIMADDNMCVTEVNAAFREMATKNLDDIKTAAPAFDLDKIIGTKVDIFHTNPAATRAKMKKLTFPHQTNIDMGKTIMSLVINDVKGDDGEPIGYVVEWQEVTNLRKTASILESLEQGLLRADFGPDGRITGANSAFGLSFDQGDPTTAPDRLADIFRLEGEEDGLGEKLKTDAPIVGRFTATVQGTTRILDGSISPVLNARSQVQSHVFLGSDITEAEEALKKSMEETAMLAHEQQSVVDELSTALRHMSNGDLTTRLNTPFKGDYETLRQNFNRTLGDLDTAISTIVESASSILSETNTLSRSADDLSRRTEQQAATLEETAAAIAELTASTASAAQGARQASDVVETARSKATASGQVVQSATEAMGKIEESSQQITRIISVIDEIAFQTNLLALNAGVEAARAGDAGRGFAVVASEVRALAQRSSDAAREISNLISTSGDHVKEGVELVGKTGAALSEISVSVQGIAEHVAAIATSANEQSTGLDEINTAMGSLDQVTQQNVAMFEETTAATHTMKGEANSLVKVTGGFQVGSSAAPASPAQPSNSVLKLENAKRPDSTPNGGPSQTGNLALVSAPEEDWEEF